MKRVIFLLFFLSAPVVLAAQDYMQTVRQALDALEHDSLDEAADCRMAEPNCGPTTIRA